LIALGPRVAIAATTANWRSTARSITDSRLEHGSEGQYTTGDSEEQDLLASGRVQKYQAKCELDDGEHRSGCEPGNGDDGPSKLLAMPARPSCRDTAEDQQRATSADGVTPLFGGDAVSARRSGWRSRRQRVSRPASPAMGGVVSVVGARSSMVSE